MNCSLPVSVGFFGYGVFQIKTFTSCFYCNVQNPLHSFAGSHSRGLFEWGMLYKEGDVPKKVKGKMISLPIKPTCVKAGFTYIFLHLGTRQKKSPQ